MDVALDAEARQWRDRAFRFATDELIPHEVEAELNEGRLPPEIEKRHKKLAVALGFSAMDVPKSHGGLELRIVDQVAVWEQLGRVTNALCWCFSEAQSWMFEACSAEQVRRFILPLMSGARKECYAITETGSGSDVVVETTARRAQGGYAISGEKWYVTSANHADYFILQAKIAEGAHAGSDSLFFVDKATAGIEVLRTPAFSHTFSAHHPTYRFTDVFVPEENRLGQEGGGMRYSHAWFRRERLMIAARCCGAAARLIDEVTAFAKARPMSGEMLSEKQAVQFMLADSLTELWAARLMTYRTAEAIDAGEDVKRARDYEQGEVHDGHGSPGRQFRYAARTAWACPA